MQSLTDEGTVCNLDSGGARPMQKQIIVLYAICVMILFAVNVWVS